LADRRRTRTWRPHFPIRTAGRDQQRSGRALFGWHCRESTG